MPYNTLMPVFAEDILAGSAQSFVGFFCDGRIGWIHCRAPQALPLGLLLTMVGVGAVIGAFVVASLPESSRRGRLLTLGNLGFPLFLLVFALSRSFLAGLILMLFVGFAFVLQNALANTLLQIVAPDELRGRIMSVYTLNIQTMMRLGGLQAGLVADWLGAAVSVAIGAGISLFYGLFVAIRYPFVRKMR